MDYTSSPFPLKTLVVAETDGTAQPTTTKGCTPAQDHWGFTVDKPYGSTHAVDAVDAAAGVHAATAAAGVGADVPESVLVLGDSVGDSVLVLRGDSAGV